MDETNGPETDQNPNMPPELPDLSDLAKQATQAKQAIDALERDLKTHKENYSALTQQILRTMDLMELDSLRAHGYLFFREVKSSVTTPKTPEDKKLLFDFLESRGIFLEIASVNSQTLNALYKDLAEQAANDGNLDFRLPGCSEPTIYTNLKLRKG